MTDTTTLNEWDLRVRLDILSLERKVQLLTGGDFWNLHPAPETGLETTDVRLPIPQALQLLQALLDRLLSAKAYAFMSVNTNYR